MKIIAWNVNGIRALIKKVDLYDYLKKNRPSIMCFSETKLSCPDIDTRERLEELVKGFKYRYYSTCTSKKGYSGTAIWCRRRPLNVYYGFKATLATFQKSCDKTSGKTNNKTQDKTQDNPKARAGGRSRYPYGWRDPLEGRLITCELSKYYLVHVYTPNSGQQGLKRLNYRVKKWDVVFRKYIKDLQKKKPVIICGDLNCAHQEIDIYNTKNKKRSAGFTNEERDSFNKLLDECDLIDSYRYKNPNKIEYSWWSYRPKATRSKNRGWRIDYYLVDKRLIKKVKESSIDTRQLGSDHAPIIFDIK